MLATMRMSALRAARTAALKSTTRRLASTSSRPTALTAAATMASGRQQWSRSGAMPLVLATAGFAAVTAVTSAYTMRAETPESAEGAAIVESEVVEKADVVELVAEGVVPGSDEVFDEEVVLVEPEAKSEPVPFLAADELDAAFDDAVAEAVAEDASKELAREETEAANQGAFNPVTGEINWDCPCLGGMAYGPCGAEFKAAFSCFVFSEAEPKGVNCIPLFEVMQGCFRKYPETYADDLRYIDDQQQESEREIAALGE
ncbi:uncharacterized protein V1518DRAFT_423341 [Limtongia smithiae]|uniref:uncharacterized protein n=1 Tax=Limtongia smithiae TaxID=1125753 RepID=UPI0034CDFEC6